MDIKICEFCKSYVMNFEVHNCFNLGNRHHRSYATIPEHSSANSAQNSDSRATQPMDYEARWSSTDQFNSSNQQSILHGMHQRTDYEEKADAEMFTQYGVTNRNPYNPENSDFMFPGMPPIQENEPNSTHLQVQSEVSTVFIHQNFQNYEPINPENPTNLPVSITERSILTGSQQAFGQRNAQMHQMAQYPNGFSQLECSGMCSPNELAPHFTSAYHERDHPEFRDRSCTAPRPNKNNFFDESNSKSSNRSKHFRIPTDDKPHQCTKCGKCFAYRYQLRDHNNVHTGEKNSCGQCGKCFATSTELRVHFRTHTGEKPYACDKCSKRYSRNSDLKRHMLRHASEDRSKCHSCGAEFSSEESLGAHQCEKDN